MTQVGEEDAVVVVVESEQVGAEGVLVAGVVVVAGRTPDHGANKPPRRRAAEAPDDEPAGMGAADEQVSPVVAAAVLGDPAPAEPDGAARQTRHPTARL